MINDDFVTAIGGFMSGWSLNSDYFKFHPSSVEECLVLCQIINLSRCYTYHVMELARKLLLCSLTSWSDVLRCVFFLFVWLIAAIFSLCGHTFTYLYIRTTYHFYHFFYSCTTCIVPVIREGVTLSDSTFSNLQSLTSYTIISTDFISLVGICRLELDHIYIQFCVVLL